MSFRNQNTIEKCVAVSGFGYWSGEDVEVQFHPAGANEGITFVRTDLPGQPRIAAHISNRSQSSRRTNICHNGVCVEMIEHIMAALSGLQIDNCEIRVNQTEMPGCDGSARAFVEALQSAGTETQSVPRLCVCVETAIRICDDPCTWIQIEPAESFRLVYRLDYSNHPQIGKQSIDLAVGPDSFLSELADARTFVLRHEADLLLQQGLGQRVSFQDLLVFDDQGPIDNPLRFPDECVRHKALDVIGDFALCGMDVVGHVTACRSGHRLNGELVKRLLAQGTIVEPVIDLRSRTKKSA